MPSFHNIKIKSIEQNTSDAVVVELAVPDALQSTYEFEAGQYLTFKHMHQGKEIRRSYSLCSAPHEGVYKVAVKHVPGGIFSSYANQHLKAGDDIDVMSPMGRFTLAQDRKKGDSYLFIAAGSGITPILSLMKSILQNDAQANVILFYGNKTVSSILFKEALEGLKNLYMGRLRLYHFLSQEVQESALLNGRITEEKCNRCFDSIVNLDQIGHAYICGPLEMIESAKSALTQNGFDGKRIHFELFSSPDAKSAPKPRQQVKATSSGAVDQIWSKVRIVLDGDSIEFDLAQDANSILDEALRKGADLPYACKGGVCCTCRAKLEEGEVEMEVNYALEPDEVEAGFILTCQSRPKTKNVLINFDIK